MFLICICYLYKFVIDKRSSKNVVTLKISLKLSTFRHDFKKIFNAYQQELM